MQELHRECLSFAQAQFSASIEAGREFARCRSPKDFLELQMRYTRSSADRILTEATKLAQLSVRVASASLQSLQARAGFAERPRSSRCQHLENRVTDVSADEVSSCSS